MKNNENPQTDAELMELAKKGDKSAFDELVIRNRDAAERFAFTIVHDMALSEDIVQDCFIKLWIYRDRYRPDFTFRTYFYTLIKHRAADVLRKNKKQIYIGEMPEKCVDLSDNSPEGLAVEKEIIRGVFAKIEELRRKSGDCLFLFAICGMKTRDIAQKLGISEAAVRVRIYRERKALKKMLDKEGLI